MKKKRTIVMVGTFVALLFFAGILGKDCNAETNKVRLGIGFATAYVPCYVAKEKGFYNEEGIEVKFVTIEIAPDMVQSVIGGTTDAGVGGSFGVMAGISKGAPVQAATFYGYGGDRIALAVRKDSGINSVRDLYGKKVGVQTGTIGHQMFINMCDVEGLDVSKIDVMPLKNVDMPAAIASKSVDAIVTWEPNPTILQEKGLVKIIQRGGKYQKSYGCVFLGMDFMKENPDTTFKFVKAHFRAMQFVRQNPVAASKINTHYVKRSTPELIQKTYKYMVFDPRVNEAAYEALKADMGFMVKQGKIPSMLDPERVATRKFSDIVVDKFPELVSDLK